MTSGAGLERLFERLFMPNVNPAELSDAMADAPPRPDDFRRMVLTVALMAVGFFVPSLLIAQVPPEQWLAYVVSAAAAGLLIGGSFVVVRAGSRWAYISAALNVLVVAGLSVLYAPYYHQLALLYALVVGAHAVVHGLGPALLATAMGAVLVPYFIQASQPVNWTDPVYAAIYLFGAALLPWSGGQLARRRADALRSQLRTTQQTRREAVLILARAAEAKDEVTGEHVPRVGDLSAELGLRAGLSLAAAEDLRFAGMLHDVGKLHLPDSVLRKTGPLSDDEWRLVKQHTIWGERILGSTAGFESARRICRWHHENWDGSGYPDGLRGDEIPLEARIVKLADVLDALRSPRPYKEAWELERCLAELRSNAGRLFDPELTRALLAMFDGGVEPGSPAGPTEPRPVLSRLSSETARA